MDEEKRHPCSGQCHGARARAAWSMARTLPLSKLKEMAGSRNWDAIHVSGVDTHHAAWLVDGFYDDFETTEVIDDSDHLHDGMILRGDDPERIACPLRSPGSHSARLQGSGRRSLRSICIIQARGPSRELVRNGAHAALGFLDEIDDEFAELLLSGVLLVLVPRAINRSRTRSSLHGKLWTAIVCMAPASSSGWAAAWSARPRSQTEGSGEVKQANWSSQLMLMPSDCMHVDFGVEIGSQLFAAAQ